MITIDEMVKSGKCPCPTCSSQDEPEGLPAQSAYGKLVNKNPPTLIRIDAELHRLLKIKAATERTTIRVLVEGVLAELLEVKGER